MFYNNSFNFGHMYQWAAKLEGLFNKPDNDYQWKGGHYDNGHGCRCKCDPPDEVVYECGTTTGPQRVGGYNEDNPESGDWAPVQLTAITFDNPIPDANEVSYNTNGVGVKGSDSVPVPNQINHHAESQESEALIAKFDYAICEATVTTSNLIRTGDEEGASGSGGEQGGWIAFNDKNGNGTWDEGEVVGQGSFYSDPVGLGNPLNGAVAVEAVEGGDGKDVSKFTISEEMVEGPFTHLQFVAEPYPDPEVANAVTDDSSDYYVQSIDYKYAELHATDDGGWLNVT